MRNHDISVGEMLDAEDEAEIGLLGRDPELQFVRLAAAYNELKAKLRAPAAEMALAQMNAFPGAVHREPSIEVLVKPWPKDCDAIIANIAYNNGIHPRDLFFAIHELIRLGYMKQET